MHNKTNFWKIFSATCLFGAALFLTYKISYAWTNPSQNPPDGSGSLSSSGGNVGVGAASPVSKLDVSGGVSIGSYAGNNAAPSNGMLVSGVVGVGTTDPKSKLDVNGGVSIGTYAGVNAAPSNGMIISGALGVGVTSVDSGFKFKVSKTGTGPSIYGLNQQGLLGWTPSSGDGNYLSVVGATTADTGTKMGVYGYAAGNGGTNMGVRGAASGIGATNWAGYFDGDIYSSGNVGLNTAVPKSRLDVVGGVSVGSYAGSVAAPSNGLIVSGNVGVGTADPSTALEVAGIITASAGLTSSGAGVQNLILKRTDNDAAIGGTINFRDNSGSIAKMEAYGSSNATTPARLLIHGDNASSNIVLSGGSAQASHLFVSSSGRIGIGSDTVDETYKTTVTAGGIGGIKVTSATDARPAGYFTNSASGGVALTTDAGGVGFGTASIDTNYKLTTSGGGVKAENDSSSNPAGYFNNGNVAGTALQTTGKTILATGGGYVGIGTTSPIQMLHIHNATDNNILFYGNAGAGVLATINDANTATIPLTINSSAVNITGSLTVGGAAWSQTTPVPYCQNGAPTAASSVVRVNTIGKTAFVSISLTDTTNGTCSGAFQLTMPFTAQSEAVLSCRAQNIAGYSGTASINAGGTRAWIVKYDNTFLGSDGMNITCSGVAEIQ